MVEQPPVGSELVRALERCWEAIGARHPDVPRAVMITGAGSGRGGGELRLGHFAAGRWQHSGEQHLAELFIGGEGLQRGGGGVLGTQLHEAADGLADIRGVKETSRQGRYHNRRFRALAEEVGLEVNHHPRLGPEREPAGGRAEMRRDGAPPSGRARIRPCCAGHATGGRFDA